MQWSIKPQNSLVGAVFQFLLRNFFRCFATGKWHEISMLYSSCCCLCDKSHCNFCLYLFFLFSLRLLRDITTANSSDAKSCQSAYNSAGSFVDYPPPQHLSYYFHSVMLRGRSCYTTLVFVDTPCSVHPCTTPSRFVSNHLLVCSLAMLPTVATGGRRAGRQATSKAASQSHTF